ncbi:MAG TPA: Rid family detoxifying hydrolase [Candidatus Hodarchaeales archaeon]|nr:Rid family detoxifying hydrolase [Candidatus Hodarchaeales archaeon]
MPKTLIAPEGLPKPVGPYSVGIRTGQLLFISGQIAINHKGDFDEKLSVGDQTKIIMKNLENILKSQKLGLNQAVKTTIFLTDIKDFTLVNEIYGGFFPSAPPARSTFQVAALPKNAKIEIEMIASFD